jgi:hypothetical protein
MNKAKILVLGVFYINDSKINLLDDYKNNYYIDMNIVLSKIYYSSELTKYNINSVTWNSIGYNDKIILFAITTINYPNIILDNCLDEMMIQSKKILSNYDNKRHIKLPYLKILSDKYNNPENINSLN